VEKVTASRGEHPDSKLFVLHLRGVDARGRLKQSKHIEKTGWMLRKTTEANEGTADRHVVYARAKWSKLLRNWME
jgi:hypothetical protein